MQDDRTTRIAKLIYKYVYGKLTRDEQHELDQWVNASVANQQLFAKLADEEYRIKLALSNTNEPDNKLWAMLRNSIPTLPQTPEMPEIVAPPRDRRILYIAAAAIVVIAVSITAWYFIQKKAPTPVVTEKIPPKRGSSLPIQKRIQPLHWRSMKIQLSI